MIRETVNKANALIAKIEDVNEKTKQLRFLSDEVNCVSRKIRLVVSTRPKDQNFMNGDETLITSYFDVELAEKLADEYIRCAEACAKHVNKHIKNLEKQLEDLK